MNVLPGKTNVNWKEWKSYEDILFHKSGDGIARIAINRPEKRNAFRPKTVCELLDAFNIVRNDESIGVVLLINNNGGNIFNNLYKNNLEEQELKKLFLMPKSINWENLAKCYQVTIKNVSDINKLREAFEWSLSMQKSVIIKVDINVENEMMERKLILKKILEID